MSRVVTSFHRYTNSCFAKRFLLKHCQKGKTVFDHIRSQVNSNSEKKHFSSSSRLSFTMSKLQELNEQNAKEIIENIDTFLFDCDGVLWDGNGVIEKSCDALLKLKELGKKVFFVTNNSSKSRNTLLKKCTDYGFPAQKDNIVGTAYIAAAYLHQIKFDGTVYMIGTEDALGEELNQYGIKYKGPGPDPLDGYIEDWLKMSVDPEVNCVLVGFDPHISYMKIMKAASYLKNPDCIFLATNMDTNLPAKAEVTIPGTGCIVVPVAHAARRQPKVLGKPEKLMFEVLQKEHNLDPARCLMVGDMLSTDIKFAENCGLKSLLVLSGNTTLENAKSKEAPAVPDFYASRFGDILNYI